MFKSSPFQPNLTNSFGVSDANYGIKSFLKVLFELESAPHTFIRLERTRVPQIIGLFGLAFRNFKHNLSSDRNFLETRSNTDPSTSTILPKIPPLNQGLSG